MKAFLMYRDRDFDPGRLMVRREKKSRHSRKADQVPSLQDVLPWNEEALRQDLGLDVLFNAMSLGDSFLLDVVKVAMLQSLTDIETIHYRQHAYTDCYKNAQIVREMYQIAIDAIEGERKNYWSFFARYPSGVPFNYPQFRMRLRGTSGDENLNRKNPL